MYIYRGGLRACVDGVDLAEGSAVCSLGPGGCGPCPWQGHRGRGETHRTRSRQDGSLDLPPMVCDPGQVNSPLRASGSILMNRNPNIYLWSCYGSLRRGSESPSRTCSLEVDSWSDSICSIKLLAVSHAAAASLRLPLGLARRTEGAASLLFLGPQCLCGGRGHQPEPRAKECARRDPRVQSIFLTVFNI